MFKNLLNVEERNKIVFFPILRFPGFEEEEWEVKKLGEIANIYDGTHQTPKYTKEGVKFVSVENINDIENTNKFITPEAFQKEYKIKPQKGDVLMTRITAGIIGATAIVKNNEPLGYYVSLALIRTKVDVDTNFLAQRIETNQFKNQLHKRIIHVAFPKKINLGDIQDCVTYFPSLVEQEKISSLMSLINDRILLSMKIIEGLITVKNSVINKIFDGKLKFTSEDYNSSDLELKKLSEFLSIPPKIKPDEIDKEKLLTVKLHLKGVHKNEKSETLSIGATNYFVRKKGQFIYGKQNLFNGAFAIIPDCYDGFLSSADVPTLEINSEKLNGKYLFYLFSRESFYKKLEDISTGSGSKRIHESDLLKVKILVPSLVKQNKIVEFLSSFDEKIIIEKDLLINYENQKKYLLANLFI